MALSRCLPSPLPLCVCRLSCKSRSTPETPPLTAVLWGSRLSSRTALARLRLLPPEPTARSGCPPSPPPSCLRRWSWKPLSPPDTWTRSSRIVSVLAFASPRVLSPRFLRSRSSREVSPSLGRRAGWASRGHHVYPRLLPSLFHPHPVLFFPPYARDGRRRVTRGGRFPWPDFSSCSSGRGHVSKDSECCCGYDHAGLL